MKPKARAVFYISFTALFLSGLIFYLLDRFFTVQGPFGPVASPARLWSLQIHSVISLWFLFLFGYIYASHIGPNLRFQRRRRSGLFFLIPMAILAVTVPGLFYLVNENAKQAVALVHTYVGLGLIIPFVIHGVLRKKSKVGSKIHVHRPRQTELAPNM